MTRAEFIQNIQNHVKMKMIVSPETSEEVQRLAFKYGGYTWGQKSQVVDHTDKRQLYLDTKNLLYATNDTGMDYFIKNNTDYKIIPDIDKVLNNHWNKDIVNNVIKALKEVL